MKLITLTTAAVALTIAAQTFAPAHAASNESFVFHYTLGDLADASRRAGIERRLERKAERYCFSGVSSQFRYSSIRKAERECQESIMARVRAHFDKRASEVLLAGDD